MEWYNEPPQWTAHPDGLTVRTGAKTDFWRVTHYDFIRDDGHFYHQLAEGNFTFEVQVTGQYRDLYDQAGVMVRIDNENWIKTGIELVEGVQQASAVVTRNFSDWSVIPLPQNPPTIWLRVKREGDTVEVHFSLDGSSYSMIRLAYFPPDQPAQVGVMCASPQGEGFEARFDGIKLTHTS